MNGTARSRPTKQIMAELFNICLVLLFKQKPAKKPVRDR